MDSIYLVHSPWVVPSLLFLTPPIYRSPCLYANPFIYPLISRPNEIVKSVTLYNTGQVIPVKGKINCKTKGGFLCFLWSRKAPALQYLGSSEQEPRRRLGAHKGDIENRRLTKWVGKHFSDTKITVEDLVFAPFRRLKSGNRLVRNTLRTRLLTSTI